MNAVKPASELERLIRDKLPDPVRRHLIDVIIDRTDADGLAANWNAQPVWSHDVSNNDTGIAKSVAVGGMEADLAYGVLIGDSVLGCVAATSTLFWSALNRTGPKRIKVATTAASTRPMDRTPSAPFPSVSLLVGPLGIVTPPVPV